MHETIFILIRTAAIFVSVLVIARILGKREVSQLSFFDFVLATAVGSMAADIAVNPDLSFFPAGLGMFVWAFLGFIVGKLSINHQGVRTLIEGRPTVVISQGRISQAGLQQAHYNLDALRMQLRNQGVFSLSDVEYAVLETNGQLSVLKKADRLPTTPKDFDLQVEQKEPPLSLIIQGRLKLDNLKRLGRTSKWLDDTLRSQGLAVSDVFYAEGDESGLVYVEEMADDHADKS